MTVRGTEGMAATGVERPGGRLREVRQALGLSLRQAAERAGGISHVAIQKIERMEGTLESVSLGSLAALSRAYGLPIEVVVAIARGRLDGARDSELLDVVVLIEQNQRYRSALDDIRRRLQLHSELG